MIDGTDFGFLDQPLHVIDGVIFDPVGRKVDVIEEDGVIFDSVGRKVDVIEEERSQARTGFRQRQSWLGWAGGGILAAAFAGLAWMGISVVSAFGDPGCVGGWRLRTAPYVFALGWTIGLWAVCGLVARRSTTVGAVALGVGVVLTLIVFYAGIAPAVWGHPDCTPHDEWWGW